MQRDGLSEDDAYKRLRKASQITGRKLHDVADTVVLALDVKRAERPTAPDGSGPPSARAAEMDIDVDVGGPPCSGS